MGCVASKLDINDVHPNMFAVNNVDDMGVKLNSGQLEITEVELVLHRRGKQPVKWPLRYLKRYGFEEGLFSFEAGRKNPTGPGIYSFKCRRAENLFNLLQVRVRSQVPASDPVTAVRSQLGGQELVPGNSSPTEEVAAPRGLPSSQAPAARNSLADNPAPASAPATAPEELPEDGSSYINCSLPTAVSPPPRVPPLHPTSDDTSSSDPLQPQYPVPDQEEGGTPGHAYENVGPLSPVTYLPPRDLFFLPPKPQFRSKIPSSTSDTSELDLGLGPGAINFPLELGANNYSCSSAPESPSWISNGPQSINYIVLDLDNTAPSPSAKLTSPSYKVDSAKTTTTGTKAAGYVTIDFDKTDALIKSANQRFFEDDDPGVRKTRHNSSLSDLGVSTKLMHKLD